MTIGGAPFRPLRSNHAFPHDLHLATATPRPDERGSQTWSRLRAGRLEGLKVRRQHPIAGRVADFVCADAKLAIELDGGVQERPDVADREVERTEIIEAKGWRIIRFRNCDVADDIEAVLKAILREARRA